MEVSIFLAKVIGIYFILISISFIINENKLRPPIISMIKSPELMLLTGFIALIMGILLVVSHNIWIMDWRIIVTLTGWLALTKGMTRMLFPEFTVDLSIKWIQNNGAYYTTFFVTFLIGAILLYFGYAENGL